jgi:hypothetical protein
MKTTVTLTDENAAGLAWAVELTGLSLEEIVNLLLADELTCFRPGAERTLRWVKERVRKGCKGRFPIVETAIRETAGSRFEIDAFQTRRNGQCERVC